jgi:hypothetical protein
MKQDASLRAEIEAAVARAYQTLGPGGLKKSDIVAQFEGRASRSTLYATVDRVIGREKPAQTLVRKVKDRAYQQAASRRRAAKKEGVSEADYTAGRAARALARVPTLPTMPDIAAPGISVVEFVAKLQACVSAAEQVMAFARKEDGSVKMSKTLLAASEHLRRSLETAVKLHEAIRTVSDIEQFHDELIALVGDVAREHPPAAELLLTRMREVAARWRG